MIMQTFITFWMHPIKRKDSPPLCERQKTYLPHKKNLRSSFYHTYFVIINLQPSKSLYASNLFIHLITFSIFLNP